MIRLLLLAALLALLLWLLVRPLVLRARALLELLAGGGSTGRGRDAGGRPRQAAERLVRCATCGVHVVESRTAVVAGQRICSTCRAGGGAQQTS